MRPHESLVKVDTDLTILESKKATMILPYQDIYKYISTTRIKLFKVMETNFQRIFDFDDKIDFVPIFYKEQTTKSSLILLDVSTL